MRRAQPGSLKGKGSWRSIVGGRGFQAIALSPEGFFGLAQSGQTMATDSLLKEGWQFVVVTYVNTRKGVATPAIFLATDWRHGPVPLALAGKATMQSDKVSLSIDTVGSGMPGESPFSIGRVHIWSRLLAEGEIMRCFKAEAPVFGLSRPTRDQDTEARMQVIRILSRRKHIGP